MSQNFQQDTSTSSQHVLRVPAFSAVSSACLTASSSGRHVTSSSQGSIPSPVAVAEAQKLAALPQSCAEITLLLSSPPVKSTEPFLPNVPRAADISVFIPTGKASKKALKKQRFFYSQLAFTYKPKKKKEMHHQDQVLQVSLQWPMHSSATRQWQK